ncbi:MAG: hypothetical protein P4L49_12865 [Desulfosporosinus sp.]|nr:hypothetical protein [Desulfosporosinus sp.]
MRQRKRWIAILMLAVFLALTVSSVAYASNTNQVGVSNNPSNSNSGNNSLLNNQQTQAYYNANKPGYGEAFIAGILVSFVKWAMGMFNLSDPVLLVFNQDPRTNKSDAFLAGGLGSSSMGNLVLGIFPEPYFNAVTVLYTAFQGLIRFPLILMLLIMAILHMLNSGTVQGRGKIKEYIQAFIVAIVTVRLGVYIWTAIIQLSNFLVNLIWAYMIQAGVKPAFFMDMIWGPGQQGFNQATQMGSIGMVVLLIMAAMMVLALNYQYTMRMITLGLLIVIFPLAATLSIFPNFRHSLPMWFKEFVANVILQLAHALALGAFFLTLVMPGTMSAGVSFWLMLTYFAGLPTIAGLIRELLGLQGGGSRVMGGMGALTGIASMAALGRMITKKPASKDASSGGDYGSGMADNLMSGSSGSSSGSTPLNGANSTLGRGAQATFNGASSIMGNKGVQTAGKFAIGATAAMTGAVMSSAMGGNAAAGAAVAVGTGAILGGKGVALLGGAGGHAKGIAQTLTSGGSIKDVGQNIVAGSMQKGGVLASAGWGLQSAVNKVSSTVGKGELFAAPSYFKGNNVMLNNANRSMEQLRPQMEMAQAKYNHAKTYFGADSMEAQPSKTQYTNLKDKFSEYEADAALARVKMRSYSELKNYTAGRTGNGSGTSGGNASYSTRRGHA